MKPSASRIPSTDYRGLLVPVLLIFRGTAQVRRCGSIPERLRRITHSKLFLVGLQEFADFFGMREIKRTRSLRPKSSHFSNGSVWESNPLGAFSKPHTGFEDQGHHQMCKHFQRRLSQRRPSTIDFTKSISGSCKSLQSITDHYPGEKNPATRAVTHLF